MAKDDYYVVKRPNENPLKTYIKRRVGRNNQNFLAFFSGQTGSGKTYAALRFAELIDPDFGMNEIVFTFDQLLDKLDDKEFMKKKFKVIVFEEAQDSLSAGNWQSKQNQEFNRILSAFRVLNIVVFFTSPRKNFVDKKTRELLHMEIKMETIVRKLNVSVSIPKFICPEYGTKDNGKYLRVNMRDRNLVKFDMMKLGLPSKELIREYEVKKSEFVQDVIADVKKRREARRQAEEPLVIDRRKRITDNQRNSMIEYAKGLTMTEIAKNRGVSDSLISREIRACEAKGYKKEEFVLTNLNKEELPLTPTRV